MDETILRLTMALEISMLAGLLWSGLCFRIPFFTFAIFCCLIEPVPALHIARYGTPRDYYLVYYAIDLFNIALYALTVAACWRSYRVISLSMFGYLCLKLYCYQLMIGNHLEQSIRFHGLLRWPNLGCYFLWAFLIWRYHCRGIKIPSRYTES
jgi:hypothetical protein